MRIEKVEVRDSFSKHMGDWIIACVIVDNVMHVHPKIHGDFTTFMKCVERVAFCPHEQDQWICLRHILPRTRWEKIISFFGFKVPDRYKEFGYVRFSNLTQSDLEDMGRKGGQAYEEILPGIGEILGLEELSDAD